jgi:catalase-peroxidase
MDTSVQWTMATDDSGIFVGTDRSSGAPKWTATTHDLIFGSSSDLRMVAFAYANANAQTRFVHDFVKAWDKVMSLDRFDLAAR